MAGAKKGAEKRYFIVNPAGAIHEVTREHAAWRLRQGAGWRMATAAEVKKYLATPVQRYDRPLADPFDPTPDAAEDGGGTDE